MAASHGVDPAEWPPVLAHLLTGDVGPLIASVLGGDSSRIVDWRPHQVTHRVGRSTVVQYRVRYEGPVGRPVTSTVVLAHGLEGPARLRAEGHSYQGWVLPDDPELPGLVRTLDPARVEAMFELIGRPIGPSILKRRAYRPGRRAVVEVTGPTGRAFLKVVRPEHAATIVDIHRRSARTLPVPRVLGCTEDGVIALTALPGRTLRDALTALGPADADRVEQLPDLAEMEALLDRLPGPPPDRMRRPRSPIDRLRRHVDLLATVLPDVGPRLRLLVDHLDGRLRTDHPLVPVHGDLYESQLMVSRGTAPHICGVLDLDTVGTGHRVDDLATLCAHLSTLAMRSAPSDGGPAPLGDPASPVGRYLAGVLRAAEADHDRDDLRARIAGRVVGLATGPFRVQQDGWAEATRRRVDLAVAWSES